MVDKFDPLEFSSFTRGANGYAHDIACQMATEGRGIEATRGDILVIVLSTTDGIMVQLRLIVFMLTLEKNLL